MLVYLHRGRAAGEQKERRERRGSCTLIHWQLDLGVCNVVLEVTLHLFLGAALHALNDGCNLDGSDELIILHILQQHLNGDR